MNRILIALLTLAISGCTTTSASAGWPHDYLDSQAAQQRRHYRPAKHRHHHKPRTVPKSVSLPSMTPGPLQTAQRCHHTFRTVGDRALSTDGAESAAWKAWEQQAQFSYGERYSDRENAESVTIECVKAEPGAVVGQLFKRCEVRARPCMAPQRGADK